MLEIGEKLEVLSAQTRTALGVWLHGGLPPDPSQACQLWSLRLRAVEACLGAEVAAITTYAQAPFESFESFELVNPLWQPFKKTISKRDTCLSHAPDAARAPIGNGMMGGPA